MVDLVIGASRSAYPEMIVGETVPLSDAQTAAILKIYVHGHSVRVTLAKNRHDTCGCGSTIDECHDYHDMGCSKANETYSSEERRRVQRTIADISSALMNSID